MPDNLEYIESYFQQTLAADERGVFETRCESDAAFAKEVAFYIATRQALREALLAQKQQQWQENTEEENEDEKTTPVIAISQKPTLLKWVVYAAAACLLLTASVFLFEAQTSTKRFADNYIKTYDWGVTMDASHDSLQLGIEANKNEDYNKALSYFEGVAKREPSNSDAKIYAGITYMQENKYDEALQKFDEVANMKDLHYNRGDFLKAVALIKRDNPGDKEAAKTLLQKVVSENEDEKEKAEEWLKKF